MLSRQHGASRVIRPVHPDDIPIELPSPACPLAASVLRPWFLPEIAGCLPVRTLDALRPCRRRNQQALIHERRRSGVPSRGVVGSKARVSGTGVGRWSPSRGAWTSRRRLPAPSSSRSTRASSSSAWTSSRCRSLSLSLSLSLSTFLSLPLSLSLSNYLSIYLTIHLSISPSPSLSLSRSVD